MRVKSHFIFKVNCKVLIRSSEQEFCDALCLRVSNSTRSTDFHLKVQMTKANTTLFFVIL